VNAIIRHLRRRCLHLAGEEMVSLEVCVCERERNLTISFVILDQQDVKHQCNHTDRRKSK
jgi:hypothetical protein